MKRFLFISQALLTLIFTSCAIFNSAKTIGEKQSFLEYGYTPLDPLPVKIITGKELTNNRLLRLLPDETVRIATGQVTGTGNISYGPISAGVSGNSYVIIVDYIKSNVRSLDYPVLDEITKENKIIYVQVYYGVGLRLIANVSVLSGKVSISNLYGLSVAAERKQISGTMTFQTLGISGPSITPLLPIPSEISTTTIQNALIAIGSIKAKMYDVTGDITIIPRVVAVNNNIGGGQKTKNEFISYLFQHPTSVNLDSVEASGASRLH